jgi:hypothetical protein
LDNEKLIRLREKQKIIAAQIRREESRINAKKRKDDTRRKILVGAAILDKASRDEQYGKWLQRLLDGFLERDDDRALFDLPPRKEDLEKAPPVPDNGDPQMPSA